MITVRIIRTYTDYEVFQGDSLILKAKDISTILNPDRFDFFDNNNQLFAKSKERSLLGLTISIKLYMQNGQIVKLIQKFKSTEFVVNSIGYSIKRTSSKTHELFKNIKLVGQLKKVKEGVSTYENHITCGSIEDCFTFSMISILLYTFDVN